MSCPDHPKSAAQVEPCIPFLTNLPSPLKFIIHCSEQSSPLWNQVQVQAHPVSISSPPAPHQIPCSSSSWSLFQFLRCSWLQCIPFYLVKAQSEFSRSASQLLVANLAEALGGAWREAGQLCACPPRARGIGMLTFCCCSMPRFQLHLELCWVMPKEISFCQPSSEITPGLTSCCVTPPT